MDAGDYPFCKVSDINGSGSYIDSARNYVTKAIALENHFNIIPAGSFLFAKIGAALQRNHRKINIVDCCVDNNIEALVPKIQSDRQYMFYLLSCIDIGWFDNRSTIPSINNSKLLSFVIPSPSIVEQSRIAAYLDRRCATIDALIANQQQQIDKLKQYKQAVITEAVTRGLDPNVRMKDSGVEWIGEVPEGWNIAALKHFATIKAGITLGGERTQLPGYVERPYLRVANVQSGGVDLSHITTLFVSPEEDQKYRLVVGDILMTEGGDRDKLGRGCVWEGQISPCLHQNHVFAIRIVSDKLIPKYLEYLTVSKVGRVYFDVTAIKTTNLACTNASKTMAFTFPLPSAIEQSEIVAFLNAECAQIDALIALKQQKADKLAQYKKSLIYEVVTGKREI